MGEETLEREDLEKESKNEVPLRGRGVAMYTPEKTQITTSITKFEDSPVFNYINSLSPIKPVKSIHITQSFNSLSFASVQSIFTSPHVSSNQESRFLRRHQLADPSKPEFSSENGSKIDKTEGISSTLNSDGQQENLNLGSSSGEASAEPSYECSRPMVEISRILSYDCGSAECSSTPAHDVGTKFISEYAGTSASLVPYVQEVSERDLFGSEICVTGIHQSDHNNESAGCDWESLISDAADLLNFDSPGDSQDYSGPHQSMDHGTKSCAPLVHDLQITKSVSVIECNKIDKFSSQHEESVYVNEMGESQDNLGGPLNNCTDEDSSGKLNDEPVHNFQRGMRRRCLVFEMVGAQRKLLNDSSACGSSALLQSDENKGSNDMQLVTMNSGNVSSRCIIPGIGLHLNALALSSKEHKVVNLEAVSSRRQLLNAPNSTASFHSLSTEQETVVESLAGTSSERDKDPDNGFPVLEDTPQASGYTENEEFNQYSPKRKRRKVENGEGEACKRCNCKKSRCLKLYCECFAAGVYCVEPCSCQGCFNKPIHEDTVLATRKQIESRNPLAFAPKVIRNSDSAPEVGDESSKTPASARHKRGCNCKKSGCLKKYCECYQGGVGCSINCRCEGCKNAFGRKDGSDFLDGELEEEETETCERKVAHQRVPEKASHDTEQNPDSAPPATPLKFVRPSAQMPYSSRSKPPRSSFLPIGSSSSSSGLYTNQRFGKLNSFQPQSKFRSQFQSIPQEEMPEILQGSCSSPISGVKSSSPNSKRVSPPHCEMMGVSPGRRSTRKLILQSIPSFPSLTPKH